jgi:hypothetical protein
LEVYKIGALVTSQRTRDPSTGQAKEGRGFTLARDLRYGENWLGDSLDFLAKKGSRRVNYDAEGILYEGFPFEFPSCLCLGGFTRGLQVFCNVSLEDNFARPLAKSFVGRVRANVPWVGQPSPMIAFVFS